MGTATNDSDQSPSSDAATLAASEVSQTSQTEQLPVVPTLNVDALFNGIIVYGNGFNQGASTPGAPRHLRRSRGIRRLVKPQI